MHFGLSNTNTEPGLFDAMRGRAEFGVRMTVSDVTHTSEFRSEIVGTDAVFCGWMVELITSVGMSGICL